MEICKKKRLQASRISRSLEDIARVTDRSSTRTYK